MDTNKLPKQALQYKTKGPRNIGRPRKRWRDQLHLEDQGTGNTPNPSGTWWWWWWNAFNTTVLSVVLMVARCCSLHCSRMYSGRMEGTLCAEASTTLKLTSGNLLLKKEDINLGSHQKTWLNAFENTMLRPAYHIRTLRSPKCLITNFNLHLNSCTGK